MAAGHLRDRYAPQFHRRYLRGRLLEADVYVGAVHRPVADSGAGPSGSTLSSRESFHRPQISSATITAAASRMAHIHHCQCQPLPSNTASSPGSFGTWCPVPSRRCVLMPHGVHVVRRSGALRKQQVSLTFRFTGRSRSVLSATDDLPGTGLLLPSGWLAAYNSMCWRKPLTAPTGTS